MKVITVAIQKGGTGKTSTAAALAQAAAIKGKRVLAVDLDPQGNLSFALGADTRQEFNNSYTLLTDFKAEPQTTAQGIDVIPAAWELSNLKTGPGSARRLQTGLDAIAGGYDLVIVDTPPTAGELQYNALQAATDLVIPLQADIYNLQSLYQIVETARRIIRSNLALRIRGFVITKLDNRSTIAKQMQEQIIIAANKNKVPYLGSIRTGVAIQEAAALQQSIFEYAPKSKPAIDYMALYEQLL